MMKMLVVDPDRCTGCRTCEVACSLYHEQECQPQLSRTRVVKFDHPGMNVPTVCPQCSRPQCLSACKQGAIGLNAKTGAVIITGELCTGCKACLIACDRGQIGFHPENRVAFKCNLCDGEPQCVRFCSKGAIRYLAVDEFLMSRKRAFIMKTTEAAQPGAGEARE